MTSLEKSLAIAQAAYRKGQAWASNIKPNQIFSIMREAYRLYPNDTFARTFFKSGAEDYLRPPMEY